MALNAAGLDAILGDGADEVVIYAAIGSGTTENDETSTARKQLTLGTPSNGVITVTNTPLDFTSTANADATHVLFFSQSTGGTFYGSAAITGDQSFNSSGAYKITALTFSATSS